MQIDDDEFWAHRMGYWRSPDQPWRTHANFDHVREGFLAQCLTVTPDMKKGIYPFKDVRLSRQDVEWLIMSSGVISLISEGTPHSDSYLDLRAADLCGVILEYLPLPRLLGGLGISEWSSYSLVERDMATAHMKKAVLNNAYLAGAHLCGAHLDGAYLNQAYMLRAELVAAHMEDCYMMAAYMVGANLDGAHLNGSRLIGANLNDASLRGALLQNADLRDASLWNADLSGADLSGTDLTEAQLAEAKMDSA